MQRYLNVEGAASSGPLIDRRSLCARRHERHPLGVLHVPFEMDGGEPCKPSALPRWASPMCWSPATWARLSSFSSSGKSNKAERFCQIDEA